jgi:hypothetical protein
MYGVFTALRTPRPRRFSVADAPPCLVTAAGVSGATAAAAGLYFAVRLALVFRAGSGDDILVALVALLAPLVAAVVVAGLSLIVLDVSVAGLLIGRTVDDIRLAKASAGNVVAGAALVVLPGHLAIVAVVMIGAGLIFGAAVVSGRLAAARAHR